MLSAPGPSSPSVGSEDGCAVDRAQGVLAGGGEGVVQQGGAASGALGVSRDVQGEHAAITRGHVEGVVTDGQARPPLGVEPVEPAGAQRDKHRDEQDQGPTNVQASLTDVLFRAHYGGPCIHRVSKCVSCRPWEEGGDGVVAAASPRGATGEPAQGQPSSVQGAVLLDSLIAIVGAGWADSGNGNPTRVK